MKTARFDARKGILGTKEFKSSATTALRAMSPLECALIGGLAVAHYANPPVTVDVDFLVLGSCADILEQIEGSMPSPWQHEFMTFDGSAPAHCIRVYRKDQSDIVLDFLPTGKNKYLRSIVENSIPVELQKGLTVPIARVEDIVVLKMIAGRDKDREDIEMLGVKMGPNVNQQYIKNALRELGGVK